MDQMQRMLLAQLLMAGRKNVAQNSGEPTQGNAYDFADPRMMGMPGEQMYTPNEMDLYNNVQQMFPARAAGFPGTPSGGSAYNYFSGNKVRR
jgi:hypothetical protein